MQFGDRESLLVEAAADLVRRELLPQVEDGTGGERLRASVMARHFARNRPFYRAMLTGSCAFAMTRTLSSVFSPSNRDVARELFSQTYPGSHDLVMPGELSQHLPDVRVIVFRTGRR